MHSKREMDLIEDAELTNLQVELGVALVEQQTGTLLLLGSFAGPKYFSPIMLILGY